MAVCYEGSRQQLIALLQRFQYEEVQVPDTVLAHSGRELNREYWDKLVGSVVRRMAGKCFLPYSVRTVITTVKSIKYIWKGICTLAKGKIEVPVLGWYSNSCISIQRRFCNSKFCHVPSGNWRDT